MHFKKLFVMVFMVNSQYMRLKHVLSDLSSKQEEMFKEAVTDEEKSEENENRIWICTLLSLCQRMAGQKRRKEFFRNQLYRSTSVVHKAKDELPEDIHERTLFATLSLQRGRKDTFRHFWSIHMKLGHATPSLIDLCLVICSFKQAFNRRTT